jgi:hypothetical protein
MPSASAESTDFSRYVKPPPLGGGVFTLVGPGPLEGMRRYIETTPIKQFDVWFAPHPKQGTLWPSEIVLTDDYYYSLKDHAVPFDFRALKAIQNNPRSQDIYLWMTQRLCRVASL